MPRTWLLLALVALAVALAIVASWSPTAPDRLPTVPQPAFAGDNGGELPMPPATAAIDEPGERTSVRVGEPAAVGPALVDVLVMRSNRADGSPLAGVDVTLALDLLPAPLLARTGNDGRVRFEVAGAEGRTAVVASALGAEARVTLTTTAPVQVVLAVQPRILVQGRVVDAAGQGIGDAALLLLPWASDRDPDPTPLRVGRSGPDGSFRIALAAGGRLGAQHRAYGPSALYLVRPADTGDVPTVTLELALLPASADVAGTVLDADGRPLAGAEVEFRSADRPPRGAELRAAPVRVRSDAAGTFSAVRLVPGNLIYGARAAGHGLLRGEVRVEPGQRAVLTLRLPPECRLFGTVRTADGAAIAGATVQAGAAGVFAAATTTAADGSYEFAGLSPGPIRVHASMRHGDDGGLLRAEATLTLQPRQPTVWHAVLLPTVAGPPLRGVVVATDGAPLAGWRVTARSTSIAQAATTTRTDGSFTLAMAAPAGTRVDLRVHAPGRASTTFADAVRRGVDPAAGDVRIVVSPRAPGIVRGRIETAERLEIPATGTAWHHEHAEFVRFVAATDGSFVLGDVPPGTLDLQFAHPGHAPATRRDLAVAAGADVDLGTIALAIGGVLFGNVRGPDGLPPAQCQLTILDHDQHYQAEYLGGTYRFSSIPVGEHTLLVQGPGLDAAAFRVTIAANLELQQDIELRAGVARRVRIDVPPGGPASVSLAIRPANAPLRWFATAPVQRDRTSSPGCAEFVASMAPGDYEAVAWAAGGYEQRAAIRFVPGDDSELRLVLAPR